MTRGSVLHVGQTERAKGIEMPYREPKTAQFYRHDGETGAVTKMGGLIKASSF